MNYRTVCLEQYELLNNSFRLTWPIFEIVRTHGSTRGITVLIDGWQTHSPARNGCGR